MRSARSPEAVRYWSKLISDCIELHSKCPKNIEVPLPSRLIDIGSSEDPSNPRLIDSKGMSGRYIALSYCWGQPSSSNPPNITTTPTNLTQMSQGIAEASLPSTVRDAIFVARSLEVRYIWIDALCILQGPSPEARQDWLLESGRMADVYQNAYVTLAAANSDSVHAGFLHDRCPSGPSRINLSFKRSKDYHPHSIFLGFPEVDYGSDFLDDPITERGWTFQERLLSTRLLVFGTREFGWECQEAAEHECGEPLSPINEMWLNNMRNALVRNTSIE